MKNETKTNIMSGLAIGGLLALATWAEVKFPGCVTSSLGNASSDSLNDINTATSRASGGFRPTVDINKKIQVTCSLSTREILRSLKSAIAEPESRRCAFLVASDSFVGSTRVTNVILTVNGQVSQDDRSAIDAALAALGHFQTKEVASV